MQNNLTKLFVLGCFFSLNTGFIDLSSLSKGNPESEVREEIDRIKHKSKPSSNLQQQEVRQLTPYKPYKLKSSAEDNPFALGSFVTDASINLEDVEHTCEGDECGDGPPQAHTAYFLENYDIEQLVFVGTVLDKTGEQIILIKTPDVGIVSTRVGEYLGKNHGEIIQVKGDGFVYREKYREARSWRNRDSVKKLLN